MEVISSTRNPTVRSLRKLASARGRAAEGRAIAEGPHLVAALAGSELSIELLITIDERDRDAYGDVGDLLVVTPPVLTSLADTQHPQGPLAVFTIPAGAPMRHHDTMVLHDIADPGNIGTLIRSAAAFGFDVVISGSTADPWSPKVMRSSAGAVFTHPPRFCSDPVEEARSLALTCTAMSPRSGATTTAPGPPTALFVGSEAHGLPDAIVAACTERLTIPMEAGIESLNAAIAGSIAMHMLASHRNHGGGEHDKH